MYLFSLFLTYCAQKMIRHVYVLPWQQCVEKGIICEINTLKRLILLSFIIKMFLLSLLVLLVKQPKKFPSSRLVLAIVTTRQTPKLVITHSILRRFHRTIPLKYVTPFPCNYLIDPYQITYSHKLSRYPRISLYFNVFELFSLS